MISFVLDADCRSDLGKAREGWIRLDGGDTECDGVWAPLRAVVEHDVTFKVVADLDRQLAVLFVVPTAAVVDSIADVQSADALGVFSSAVVVVRITMVLLEFDDAVLEGVSLDNHLRVESFIEVVLDLLEARRDLVEARLQLVVLLRVLGVRVKHLFVVSPGLLVVVSTSPVTVPPFPSMIVVVVVVPVALPVVVLVIVVGLVVLVIVVILLVVVVVVIFVLVVIVIVVLLVMIAIVVFFLVVTVVMFVLIRVLFVLLG
jgi:hypothetical protein